MAAPSAGDPVTNSTTFSMQLETMRQFAEELRRQLDAFGVTRDTTATLKGTEVRLGAFDEANLLVGRHAQAVAQLEQLVIGIEHAMHFAEDVTHVVRTEVTRATDEVASSIAAVGVAPSERTAGAVTRGTAG